MTSPGNKSALSHHATHIPLRWELRLGQQCSSARKINRRMFSTAGGKVEMMEEWKAPHAWEYCSFLYCLVSSPSPSSDAIFLSVTVLDQWSDYTHRTSIINNNFPAGSKCNALWQEQSAWQSLSLSHSQRTEGMKERRESQQLLKAFPQNVGLKARLENIKGGTSAKWWLINVLTRENPNLRVADEADNRFFDHSRGNDSIL